jgi:hypothetical protein
MTRSAPFNAKQTGLTRGLSSTSVFRFTAMSQTQRQSDSGGERRIANFRSVAVQCSRSSGCAVGSPMSSMYRSRPANSHLWESLEVRTSLRAPPMHPRLRSSSYQQVHVVRRHASEGRTADDHARLPVERGVRREQRQHCRDPEGLAWEHAGRRHGGVRRRRRDRRNRS